MGGNCEPDSKNNHLLFGHIFFSHCELHHPNFQLDWSFCIYSFWENVLGQRGVYVNKFSQDRFSRGPGVGL